MSQPINIELFSASDCNRCLQVATMINRVLQEFPRENIGFRKVNVLDEIDYAVSVGVIMTPAVAINSKLLLRSAPGEKSFRRSLEKVLGNRDAWSGWL